MVASGIGMNYKTHNKHNITFRRLIEPITSLSLLSLSLLSLSSFPSAIAQNRRVASAQRLKKPPTANQITYCWTLTVTVEVEEVKVVVEVEMFLLKQLLV